jgi:hypothetical protein
MIAVAEDVWEIVSIKTALYQGQDFALPQVGNIG